MINLLSGIVCVDIGGTLIKSGLLENGKLKHMREIATSPIGGEAIVSQVAGIVAEHPAAKALGVSSAGEINVETGVVVLADNIPGYTNLPLRDMLESRTGLPVIVENDVNAAAIGELHFGSAKKGGFSDFLMVSYGTGIGGAIVQNGQIVRGGTGSAGEIGGLITHPEDVTFKEVGSGSYEKYASTTALLKSTKMLSPSVDNGRTIFMHMEDPAIQTIVNRWIDEICYGLVGGVHLLNPQAILLGGGIMEEDYVSKRIKQRLSLLLKPSFKNLEIIPAALGNSAALYGAGYLAYKKDRRRAMDEHALRKIKTQVQNQLKTCTQFWLENGIDEKHGGVYTCLDEKGEVYSTDKSVWMQGRCAWTFSYLCNEYEEKPAWRNAAKSCIDFLEKFCRNEEAANRMYFTVTEDGKPLRQRRYCFSETFYVMANSEYYLLTGEPEYLNRAKEAYELVWKLNKGLIADPTGLGAKTISETRKGRSFADTMIYLNISLIMEKCDKENAQLYLGRAQECADIILEYHYKPELQATLEFVGLNGEFMSDISAGRVVNPGHSIEGAWFLLEYAKITQNESVKEKAIEMFDVAFENGWDDEFGGLLYYIDVLRKPPEAYEHDMKLWWPHNELLIAALMIYKQTGKEKYLDIFLKTWDYAMKVFNDEENGEWHGYLRRDGMPTLPAAKGSTFKGPFHYPRMLIMLDKMLENI